MGKEYNKTIRLAAWPMGSSAALNYFDFPKRQTRINHLYVATQEFVIVLFAVEFEIGDSGAYGGSAIAIRICCSLVFSHNCLHGSSGCLGSNKASYHKTFKGHNNHFRQSSKAVLFDDFWSASPSGMENSTNGSISSTSVQIQVQDAGCSNNPSEFVNHGLLAWNQTRQKWIECKKPKKRSRQLLEPKLSWNDTYDSVLGSNKPFPKPVPLNEMVDFLVDIWEQDGLYDE